MTKELWLNSKQITDLNCAISYFSEAARAVLQYICSESILEITEKYMWMN